MMASTGRLGGAGVFSDAPVLRDAGASPLSETHTHADERAIYGALMTAIGTGTGAASGPYRGVTARPTGHVPETAPAGRPLVDGTRRDTPTLRRQPWPVPAAQPK
jgi:hypothetical protein